MEFQGAAAAETGVAVEFVVVVDQVDMIVEPRALVHSLRVVVVAGDMPDNVEELIGVALLHRLHEELALAACLRVVEVAFQHQEVQEDVHQKIAGLMGPYSYLQVAAAVAVLTSLVAIQLGWAVNDLQLLEHLEYGHRRIVGAKKVPCSYLQVAAVAVQASLGVIQLGWAANDLQLLEHVEVGVDLGYDL